MVRIYDARGNLIDNGTNTFVYDYLNRVTQMRDASGTTILVRFAYDPLGRLYSVDAPGSPDDRRYLWDGDSIIARYEGLTGSTIEQRYVHGGPGSLGAPLVQYDGAGVATTDRHWLLPDERGSVVTIADGDDGTVEQVNSYGPYGEPGAANMGEFGYAGQLWIPEANLLYMRARMYDYETGRFMQTDPIGYAGGMNLYGYVGNDPVNGVDPLGLADTDGLAWRQTRPQSPIGCTGSRACIGRAWSGRPGATTAYSGGGVGTGGGGGGGGGGTSGGGGTGQGGTGGGSPGGGSGYAPIVVTGGYSQLASYFGQSIDIGIANANSTGFSQAEIIRRVIVVTARRSREIGEASQDIFVIGPRSDPWIRLRRVPDYCGGSDAVSSGVPDSVGGINISAACRTHDACYGSSNARLTCDRGFYNDIYSQCRRQGGGNTQCSFTAGIYYRGVRWFGKYYYDGSGQE